MRYLFSAFFLHACLAAAPAIAQDFVRLTFNSGDDIAPAWSPGAENLIYLRSQFGFDAPYDVYGALGNGPGFETALFSGPAFDLGPAYSPAWVGFTTFIALYEHISVPEYLFFDVRKSPFFKSAFDGPESAYFPFVFADSGFSGGYVKLSRDGSTMFIRAIDPFGGASLRSASIFDVLFSSFLPLPLSSFGIVQLASDPATGNFFTQGVAISPDGTFFVAALPIGNSNTPHDLWLFRTDAQATPVNLTNAAGLGVWSVAPDFSPDGQSLIFSAWSGRAGETFDLYGLDLDGVSVPVQLTNTPRFAEYGATWAPDGLRVAFQGRHEFGFESDHPALFAGESSNWNIYTLQVRVIREVAPNVVPNLPQLEILSDSVLVSGEEFKGASLTRAKQKRLKLLSLPGMPDLDISSEPANKKKKNNQLKIRYVFTLERLDDGAGNTVSKDIRRKVSKRNRTTFSKLRPGTYRTSYKVDIQQVRNGKLRTVGSSRPSLSSRFRFG